jgi:hypothetical protein
VGSLCLAVVVGVLAGVLAYFDTPSVILVVVVAVAAYLVGRLLDGRWPDQRRTDQG